MPRNRFKRILYFIIVVILFPFEKVTGLLKKRKDVLVLISYQSISERALFLCDHLRKRPDIRIWACDDRSKRLSENDLGNIKRAYRFVPYFLARLIKWDLIIYATASRPFRHDAKKAYVRHGLSANKLDEDGDLTIFGKMGRDARGEYIYDTVFVESSHMKGIILGKYPEMQDRLRIAGSLYMKKISMMKRDREAAFRKYSLDPSKKLINIVSTWDRSLSHFCGETLMKELPAVTEKYNVILSVHPKTVNPTDVGYDPVSEKLADFRPAGDYVFMKDSTWTDLVPYCDMVITDHTSACFYFLPFVSGVIFFEGPGVELWKEAPISELKELSLKVSDLDGLEGLVEKEFSLGKKEKYASLGRRVFGDYDNALEDHEKEIMRLLGKDQEDFWQK